VSQARPIHRSGSWGRIPTSSSLRRTWPSARKRVSIRD
jgi:hypothetical protein